MTICSLPSGPTSPTSCAGSIAGWVAAWPVTLIVTFAGWVAAGGVATAATGAGVAGRAGAAAGAPTLAAFTGRAGGIPVGLGPLTA